MRYVAVVSLLVATMSAQNAPSTNKGRHLDIPAISREANGAVVSIIMADNKGQPIAQGSGFVVSRNGLVATNYHVIKSGTSAVINPTPICTHGSFTHRLATLHRTPILSLSLVPPCILPLPLK